MNWNYFNTLGYLSVILWISVPLLCFVHSRMKPRRWLCHVALLLALLALLFAKINSETHVNRIQPDRSEQLAGIDARQEAKRQAALDSRGDEVAQIRFAEDGSEDFFDQAGMDEADLKYMEKLNEAPIPEWQKKKKSRGSGGSDEADLEEMIGAESKSEGVSSEALDQAVEAEPILMGAKDVAMANRLDAINLNAIRVMLLLAVVFIVIDYLRRANVYREAYLPLPLPSSWINPLTPPPAIFERPERGRRTIPDELKWLHKRGDSFIYLTDDPNKAKGLEDLDLLRVADEDHLLKDEFVFETLWYGRGSLVVDSTAHARHLLEDFVPRLERRKTSKARVSQTAHLVWDIKEPLPEKIRTAFERLLPATGISLFLCQNPK